MKGKQSVYYRTCSDKFLTELSKLPHSVGNVLLTLLYLVDKNDNCVQEKFSDIVKTNKWDRGNSNRYLNRLKKEGFIKDVVDIHGKERLMIDPRLVWSTGRDKVRFAINMFVLGSHGRAVEHSKAEKESGGYIDPESGLLVSEYQNRLDQLKKYEEDQKELAKFLHSNHGEATEMPYEFFACIATESVQYLVDGLGYTTEFLG